MAVASSQVSVSTTATLIPAVRRIKNAGSATVYIGGSTVSSTTGYPLATGAEVYFYDTDAPTAYDVYAVVASGTGTVATLSA